MTEAKEIVRRRGGYFVTGESWSGPCLPKALPLASRTDLRRLSFESRCAPLPCAAPQRSARGSIRTSNPCAYPCEENRP